MQILVHLTFHDLTAISAVILNENICVNWVIRGLECYVLQGQIPLWSYFSAVHKEKIFVKELIFLLNKFPYTNL